MKFIYNEKLRLMLQAWDKAQKLAHLFHQTGPPSKWRMPVAATLHRGSISVTMLYSHKGTPIKIEIRSTLNGDLSYRIERRYQELAKDIGLMQRLHQAFQSFIMR